MADNELTVIVADSSTKVTRSIDRRGTMHQGVLIGELPDIVPALTGGTFVYTVGPGASVALIPPTAAPDFCRLRFWQTGTPDGKRLFFRKDGTSPLNDGTNAEGYVLHQEAMSVKILTMANFKMIAEAASANWTVYAEWLRSA